jgi:Transposase DDE domain
MSIMGNIFEIMKQSFERVVPMQDGRTDISPLMFVVTLVFSYLGDSKTFSLECIRRMMQNHFNKKMSRSAFWERLSRRRLKEHLRAVVAELMKSFSAKTLLCETVLEQLKVTAILILDSSSITLVKAAKDRFPGTGSKAGIKWHACFNALTGVLEWFQLTPSRTHDRKCVPDLVLLKGKLIIFDLGYFDYHLMLAIDNIGGFFLSRLKSNAVVTVVKVVKGLSDRAIGKSLLSLGLHRKKGEIIEAIIEKVCTTETLRCRAIGFWNPVEKCYHWYVTNLVVPAFIIYPLYRFRWQIELIFKGCKNSLNANQITSADTNIIESLLLASIASHLCTHTILTSSLIHLDNEQQQAISFQRAAKIAVVLSREFVMFLLNRSREYLDCLLEKIKLFANELIDPNYKKRETSLRRICRMLELEAKT